MEAQDLQRAIPLHTSSVNSEPGTEELRRQGMAWLRGLAEETVYSFFLDRDEDEYVHTRLGEISVPTLVMHGTEDMRIPLEYGRVIAERIPGGLLYPFQGCCHVLNTTAVGEFCRVLRHFVRRGEVPAPPGAGTQPHPASPLIGRYKHAARRVRLKQISGQAG